MTGAPLAAADLPELPVYSLDLSQTTVSGISSGAFMAVQFGTAHSANVIGVASTAGGPYYCAHDSSLLALRKCMQGDPMFPAMKITPSDIERMQSAAREWSRKGWIDDVSNLSRQRVWAFHGYNDGIVKKPVSDTLQDWYGDFVPSAQRFYKDNIRATHGQITAGCAPEEGGACSACAKVGKNFINVCQDKPVDDVYDAAGSALQFFYGPLVRTGKDALKGKMLEFTQAPFVFDRDETLKKDVKLAPKDISMAEKGYVYVPADCAAGQTCRLHIAFHGCMQYAEQIGPAFIENAGFNEWADANRIIVLYPQAIATKPGFFSSSAPLNPQGCWDWWGYNFNMARHRNGQYAMRDGVQIAAVWRMAQRLAGGGEARWTSSAISRPVLNVIDRSASEAMLSWLPVTGAAGYHIYRDDGSGTALRRLTPAPLVLTSYADSDLAQRQRYTYELRVVDGEGREQDVSGRVGVITGTEPPVCDPYFSMLQGRPVDRFNMPVDKECP